MGSAGRTKVVRQVNCTKCRVMPGVRCVLLTYGVRTGVAQYG